MLDSGLIWYLFTISFCFHRFSKMPCCCKDNVQASFVIGIVLAVLCVIGIAIDFSPLGICLAIVGALIHCILIFGAHKRNRTAILGRFKTFFSLRSFCNFWLKLRELFWCFCCLSIVFVFLFYRLSVAFPVVFLFPFLMYFCCLSIAFLLLFSCVLEIERTQKGNRKATE